jgi:hypothetical protein
VGVPAARGHGVMEVQTFEALGGGLEHDPIVPSVFGGVDRPLGSIGPGTNVLVPVFAAVSLPPHPALPHCMRVNGVIGSPNPWGHPDRLAPLALTQSNT